MKGCVDVCVSTDIDLDDENLRQGTFQRGWVNVYLIIRDVFQKQNH